MANALHPHLTLSEWHGRLDDLACDSVLAGADEQCLQLRAFHELMLRAPDWALLDGIVVPSTARVEELLRYQAFEAAALAFVDTRAGYMVSRGSGGLYIASVALSGHAAEASASGATLALALLAAIAAAIGNHAATHPRFERRLGEASRRLH